MTDQITHPPAELVIREPQSAADLIALHLRAGCRGQEMAPAPVNIPVGLGGNGAKTKIFAGRGAALSEKSCNQSGIGDRPH